ncbi:MAG: hypothetical protein KC620_09965 [Myxococcales bacterium]|nr:hypothetical protein [Myxococcales bacterium]
MLRTPITIRAVAPLLICGFALGGCDLLPTTDRARLALKEGLAAAEEAGRLRPLAAEEVDTGARLGTVLARPLSEVASTLGGRAFAVQAQFALRAGADPQVTLREETRLVIDAGGQFMLRQTTDGAALGQPSVAEGRSCWWVDGQYFVARRHGPATALPVRAYEQDRCLDSGVESVSGFLRLLAPRLLVSSQGPIEVAGRPALALALVGTAEADGPPSLPLTWPGESDALPSPAIWGPRGPLLTEYGRLLSLEGTLALDVKTGQPLQAEVNATLAFEKGGRALRLTAKLTLKTELDATAIKAPEDARVYAARPRLFADRAFLLGDRAAAAEDEETTAALPKPGDAPRLTVGPSGELQIEDAHVAPSVDEDRPRPLPLPGGAPAGANFAEDAPE